MRLTSLPAAALAAVSAVAALPAQCAVTADLAPGAADSSPIRLTTVFGQELYLTANHPTFGSEVFRWDQANGLQLVADLHSNGGVSAERFAWCCTAAGPRVFFDGFVPGIGRELWLTDGTSAGTTLLKDIRAGSSSSNPTQLISFDDRLLFVANDGSRGNELWITDGTAAGTVLLLDIEPGSGSSAPNRMVRLGNRVLFSALQISTGRELWATDGTAAGTVLLRDLLPGPAAGLGIGPLVRCGDAVYFGASDPTVFDGLFKTDGTAAGTVFVADVGVGVEMCACDGTLFFSGDRSTTNNFELWKTDGTTAGTVRVKDIRPGPVESSLRELTCSGDRLFFAASGSSLHGTELWVSDGTDGGTVMVADIDPGPASSTPTEIVAAATGVCFRARVQGDSELWFSDGTAAGTWQVCDIDPNASGNPTALQVCAGKLFFTADHPTAGRELMWVPTPGATQTVLGTGSRPDHPTLAIRSGAPPVLGTTIELVAQGPVGHVAALFLGPSQAPAASLAWLVQGGCDWVGILTPFPLVIATSASPSFNKLLPIPNQPMLEGAPVALQVVWVNFAANPVLQLSNGVQIVLGPAAPH